MKQSLLIIVAFICYYTTNAQCGSVRNLKLSYQTNFPLFAKALYTWQAPLSGTVPISYQWEARTSGRPLSGSTGLLYSGSKTGFNTNFIIAPGVSYTFYIRSTCGVGTYSNWDSLRDTHCTFNPPYLVDLSSGVPACSELKLNAPYDIAGANWQVTSNQIYFCVQSSPSDATFKTPLINLKKDTTYTFSYYWNGNGTGNYSSNFFGQLPTFGSGTREIEFKSTIDQQVSITFNAETNPNNSSGCLYINNIAVKKLTCGKPRNINTKNITTSSVTINWQPSNVGTVSSYDVKIVDLSTGLNAFSNNAVADTFVNVTGLLPGKNYKVTVYTSCVQGPSVGSEALFTTLCNAKVLPYIQNFEASIVPDLPNCTSVKNIGTAKGWATEAPNNLPWFSGKVLKYEGSSNANSWFFTNGLKLQAGKTYRLSFKCGNNGVFGTEKLEVKYGTNFSSSAMTTTIVSLPTINGIAPEVVATTFTPAATGTYYIGFHAYSVGSSIGLLYLDDISVSKGNLIDATLFVDNNGNNIKDANEPLFANANIITSKRSDTIITHTSTGRTYIEIDTGNYVTTVKPDRPYYTVSPAMHQTNFATNINIDSVYFGLKPIPNKRDLSISLIPLNVARPGFPMAYQLICKNNGTDSANNFSLQFYNNAKLNFNSATISPSTFVGDTLKWNITQLNPGEAINIFLSFSVLPPPVVNNGDYLMANANVSSTTADIYPADNKAIDFQIVRGSYDPNDKKESHGGEILKTDVDNGEYLQYTIRFQNTGTDTAFNVYIRDTLSSLLDWSSLEMLAASADYKLTVRNGNQLLWGFDNINLPDSNTNEAASHGFVTFRIKPKATVTIGNIITNNAFIYFDFNLPIETNTEITKVVSKVFPLRLLSFSANADGEKNILNWATANEINIHHFDIERSADGKAFTLLASQKAGNEKYAYADIKPLKGNNYYRLKIVENDGLFSYSAIRLVKDNSLLVATLFPNPAKNKIQIRLNNQQQQQEVQVQVISAEGKMAASNVWTIPQGASIQNMNIAHLQKGIYLIKITGENNEQTTLRFEKL